MVHANDSGRSATPGGQPSDLETSGVSEPGLEEVLSVVFGMSASELDVCLCVMDLGEATTANVAGRLDVDRSLVSRHLNHLADIGVVEKRRQLRKAGGEVYVYTPNEVEEVREGFKRGLRAWVVAADRRIEAISREKVESIVDGADGQTRIFAEE